MTLQEQLDTASGPRVCRWFADGEHRHGVVSRQSLGENAEGNGWRMTMSVVSERNAPPPFGGTLLTFNTKTWLVVDATKSEVSGRYCRIEITGNTTDISEMETLKQFEKAAQAASVARGFKPRLFTVPGHHEAEMTPAVPGVRIKTVRAKEDVVEIGRAKRKMKL